MTRIRNIVLDLYSYRASLFVYIWIGSLSALVNWFVFYTFCIPLQWHYGSAAIAAFMIATATNYVLSERIGFLSNGRSKIRQILGVYLVSAVGLCVDLFVLAFLHEYLGIDVMVSKTMGTASAFFVNYAGRQFLVFLRQPRWTSLSALTREFPIIVSRDKPQSSHHSNQP